MKGYPMTQEKDKFICEKLGICWHEWKSDHASFTCIKCGYRCNSSETPPKNLDFTSEAGRVQLLKLLVDKDEFWLEDDSFLDLEDFMLDDTGKFRDAVYKWLGR